ncbi:dormancy-associated protein like protein 4, partial [Quercus suber]
DTLHLLSQTERLNSFGSCTHIVCPISFRSHPSIRNSRIGSKKNYSFHYIYRHNIIHVGTYGCYKEEVMGFLHKLWDETLAGPPPETGLGKLRKHDSFSASRSPPMVIPHDDHQVPVTRSITILRTGSHLKNLSADSGSAPGSPSGSSTPGTPHSPGTPGLDFRKIQRKIDRD